MARQPHPGPKAFGLLPEPERSPASFIGAAVINTTILGLVILFGLAAHKAIERRAVEKTELVFPATTPPATPPVKIKLPTPPKVETPKLTEAHLDAPRIALPTPEPKPVPKPELPQEAKLAPLPVTPAHPTVKLAPQVKAALPPAAAPTIPPQTHAAVAETHLGDLNGARPSAAGKQVTMAAIGNPYGGAQGGAEAPRGKVASTGLGNGQPVGANAGYAGRVARAGILGGATATGSAYGNAKVASAGIPAIPAQNSASVSKNTTQAPTETKVVLLNVPKIDYTQEAHDLRIQGDIVLRVTFLANGRVVVQGVLHGLGHGLDEAAKRAAEQIRFQPATRNGQPVDETTNVSFKCQLA